MAQNKDSINNINLAELVGKLKNEDERYSNLSRRIQIIYWILIPIYSVLLVLHFFEKSSVADIISSLCYLFAMLIFGLFFRNYYKEYKYVDYSLPTQVMLKNAVYRYKPFQLKTLWVLAALILMDIGLSLNTSLNFDFVKVQVIFLGSCVVSLSIGLLIWKVRYKPLRDGALTLLREIEGEE